MIALEIAAKKSKQLPVKSVLLVGQHAPGPGTGIDPLTLSFEREGFSVDVLSGCESLLRRVRRTRPTLVVLDVTRPDEASCRACHKIRRLRVRQPSIMILATRADEMDVVAGFEAGADDFVRRPIGMRELMLRATLLSRRAAREASQAGPKPPRSAGEKPLLRQGQLQLDRARHAASFGGRPIRLTATEFNLLHYLASHPDVLLPRMNLLRAVWGYEYQGYMRTVDTHVARLRQKLVEAGGSDAIITTIWRSGYRFDPTSAAPQATSSG